MMCMGCVRWAWKRLTYIGAYDSETWSSASPADFEPVPRIYQITKAVSEDDLSNPKIMPASRGYTQISSDGIHKQTTYTDVGTACPPYLVYVDCRCNEVVLAVRGLNLVRNTDYKVLMGNKLGMQMFDGGYVHHGLLKAAQLILEREMETLRELLQQQGPDFKLPSSYWRGRWRRCVSCCTSRAPTASSSSWAVKYTDVIHSIVLQVPAARRSTR